MKIWIPRRLRSVHSVGGTLGSTMVGISLNYTRQSRPSNRNSQIILLQEYSQSYSSLYQVAGDIIGGEPTTLDNLDQVNIRASE